MVKNPNAAKDDSEQNLSEIIYRLDERANSILKTLEQHDDAIKELSISMQELSEEIVSLKNNDVKKDFSDLRDKAHALEVRLENFQFKLSNHDRKWATAFDSLWKLAITLLASIILYKLGYQN